MGAAGGGCGAGRCCIALVGVRAATHRLTSPTVTNVHLIIIAPETSALRRVPGA
jgi:hypothetical protein